IQKGDSPYPPQLSVCLGEAAPSTLSCIGNIDLLKSEPLALFCSNKCPGSLILRTYDLAQKLREEGRSVISGFHSPVERECLNILLRGNGPIIACPARGLERMRIHAEYQEPLNQNRLLLLSPFSEKVLRADSGTATARNAVVAALARDVFVAHAEAGSKTAILCNNIMKWKKDLHTLDNPTNDWLLALGAKPILLRSSHVQS
ncbi:MAG TPA: DNA-processing protein DprA, partial [Pyrinomonadaceae bacterium]|nr:DNA-processing protein DprA [Pyrinomonadaceae bacterium]